MSLICSSYLSCWGRKARGWTVIWPSVHSTCKTLLTFWNRITTDQLSKSAIRAWRVKMVNSTPNRSNYCCFTPELWNTFKIKALFLLKSWFIISWSARGSWISKSLFYSMAGLIGNSFSSSTLIKFAKLATSLIRTFFWRL